MEYAISKRYYPREDENYDKPKVFCEDCDTECAQETPTKEECRAYGCGRSYPCCTIAGTCPTCKKRWIGMRAAPEMDGYF